MFLTIISCILALPFIIIFLIWLGYQIFDYYSLKNLSQKDQNQKIVIIGSGFSGLLAGIKLREMGLKNFKILESEASFGGTWYKNTYPGCECDIRSHLYSYSFFCNPNWVKNFPGQADILEYTRAVVKKFKLESFIVCNSKVVERKWNEEKKEWVLKIENPKTKQVRTESYNFCINAIGPLTIPSYPEIDGANTFKGKQMHTAQWDNTYDYKNKNVVVIGSAASAVQTCAEIAKDVKNLYVFQRTANYVAPKLEFPYPEYIKMLFKYLPFTMKIYRYFLFLRQELQYYVLFNLEKKDKVRDQVVNLGMIPFLKGIPEETQKKLIPDYAVGCKRILVHDYYYDIYRRDNVFLETDGVQCIGENFVQTKKGKKIENVDLIVYATGFKVSQKTYIGFGKEGYSSKVEDDKNGITAYKSTFLPKFPNEFTLIGANSGLGHNSIIHIMECQVRYISKFLEHVIDNDIKYIEVKQEAYEDYQKVLIPKEKNSIWIKGGCDSWYKSDKRLFALHVGYSTEFWWKFRNIDPQNFILKK